jgi:hypothetical protein
MLPTITLSSDPSVIADNTAKIREARAIIKGLHATLDGMHMANVGMCSHSKKSARYDPNYAGGGFSHFECPTCGGNV